MFKATIPVLAVTEMTLGLFACFFLSTEIIAFKSNDFPVPTSTVAPPSTQSLWGEEKMCLSIPAEPVKKTFFPSLTTILITIICSLLSTMSSTFLSTPLAMPSSPEPSCTVTLCVKKASIVSLGCFMLQVSSSALDDLHFEVCFFVDLFISWKSSK